MSDPDKPKAAQLKKNAITTAESSPEFTARLDRDSAFRIAALQTAVQRAGLREHMSEDREEVTNAANYYYHWMKGDGDGDGDPVPEVKRQP